MNHWKPSRLAEPMMGVSDAVQDRLEVLHERNISRSSTGSIDGAARLYSSDAEDPNEVAPFLARNMQTDYQNRDLQERTYLVLQGGDTLYHTEQDVAARQRLPMPRQSLSHAENPTGSPELPQRKRSRVRGHFPDRQHAFGHTPKGEQGYRKG